MLTGAGSARSCARTAARAAQHRGSQRPVIGARDGRGRSPCPTRTSRARLPLAGLFQRIVARGRRRSRPPCPIGPQADQRGAVRRADPRCITGRRYIDLTPAMRRVAVEALSRIIDGPLEDDLGGAGPGGLAGKVSGAMSS
jgi:hypothetical protein